MRLFSRKSHILRVGIVSMFSAATLMILPSANAIVAVAVAGSTIAGYGTPVVFVPQGHELTFANGDIDAHNVFSTDKRLDGSADWCVLFPKGGCPLFYSNQLALGETGTVFGVSSLIAGQYLFYCGPHPWMTGKIVVN